MKRRHFLAGMAAAAAAPGLSWADAGSPILLAAAREAAGGYALFGIAADGSDAFRVPLPDRGHAAAAHPTRPEAVAFARRPGRFALVIDCVSGKVLREIEAPEGRHFYGHGAFIEDGEILCTTENDFSTGEGRIGFWARSENWTRIGDIKTHGIGPHDVKRMANDVLVVANGGIRTHPDKGRDKLNLMTMEPSLTYLTPQGEMLEQVVLPYELHHNSIRHLALGPDGLVAFAMQWQGDPSAVVPLLGLHRRGQAAALAKVPPHEGAGMKGYAGSVAIDRTGRQVAITSPRGGKVQVFDARGRFSHSVARGDVCGIAPAPDGFFLSDGAGALTCVTDHIIPLRVAEARAWDNHLIEVGA